MSGSATFNARIQKEQKMFTFNPPPGVCVWSINDSIYEYHAVPLEITGPEDSPYDGGQFELNLTITNRYPFEPPKLRFTTPIYHPNIDNTGRICLDLLKMPPAGNWQPSINICVLLTSLRLLLASPNPTDPLMVDISEEYLKNNSVFLRKARESTLKYAKRKESRKRELTHEEDTDDLKRMEIVNIRNENEEKTETYNNSESSDASWSD